jgi:hypothetical protein
MDRISRCFRKVSIPLGNLLVICLYLYHFSIIKKYAVNVPYWDEWEYFKPEALPSGLTLHWLFKFHNEHRIVFTKLLAWLNLKILGLDFEAQQLFNFLLFGCLLFVVYLLVKRVTAEKSFPHFPLFMIFLLSPLNYENHLWGFQSQFHLVLLFSLLALAMAFPERITPISTLWFSLLTILASYSFSAGVVFSLVFAGCFLIYCWGSYCRKQVSRRVALSAVAIVAAVMGIGLVLWFQGYARPPLHPELVMPSSVKFWDFLLGLAGFGFGYTPATIVSGRIAGVISLLIVLLPVVLLLANGKTRWSSATWTVAAGSMATLALLATIAMARAEIEVTMVSRYNEFAFMLIPFAALGWWLAIKQNTWRSVCLFLLWVFCGIGYFDKRSFALYEEVQNQRNTGLACIASYGKKSGDGNCPMIYDVPINTFIDQAQLLPVRFLRNSK